MTTTYREPLPRDRDAAPKNGPALLDRTGTGYAPPRLEVLGTLRTLSRNGSPTMLGGSL